MIGDFDLGLSLRISTSGELDRDFPLGSGDRDLVLDMDLDSISGFCGFSLLRRGDLDLLDLELDLDGLLRDFCNFSLRSDDLDLESDLELELDRNLFFLVRDFLLRSDDFWRDLDFDLDNLDLDRDLEIFLFFLDILFILLRDLDLELESDLDES